MFEEHLEHLEDRGLISLVQTNPELAYLFRHALIQDAAYNSLLHKERKHLHQSTGETLERLYADRLEEFAAVLGQHFAKAEDDERAFKYFKLAGDNATRLYANTEAIEHYTQALQVADNVDCDVETMVALYTRLGRVFELNGAYEQALQTYQAMQKLGEEKGNRHLKLSALLEQAKVQALVTTVFNYKEAELLTQNALKLAQELGDFAAEAKAWWIMINPTAFSVNFNEGLTYGLKSLAIAREHGLTEQMAYTLMDIQRIYLTMGDFDHALASLNEAYRLWQQLDNKPLMSDTLSSMALVYYIQGDIQKSFDLSSQAVDLSVGITNFWGEAFGRTGLGRVEMAWGYFSTAQANLEKAIVAADESGSILLQVIARVQLAWLYTLLGQLEQGFALSTWAFNQPQQLPPNFISWAIGVSTIIALRLDNLAYAEKLLVENTPEPELRQKNINILFSIWTEMAWIELFIAKEAYQKGLELTEKIITVCYKIGAEVFLAEMFFFKARILLAQQQYAAAIEAFKEAITVAEKLSNPYIHLAILIIWGDALTEMGQVNEATQLYQQASRIKQDILQNIHQPDLRASFETLPFMQVLNQQ